MNRCRPPGRRDRDARDAVLADDALPQGVVAVQDDHLVRRAQEGVDLAGQDRAERGEEQGRIGDVAELVPLRVIVVVDRIEAEVVRAEQAEAGDAVQRGGDLLLDPGE